MNSYFVISNGSDLEKRSDPTFVLSFYFAILISKTFNFAAQIVFLSNYESNLHYIAHEGIEREEENDDFRLWLKGKDSADVDALVHTVYENVNGGIDCTLCGNCCRTLVINVTHPEVDTLATHLAVTPGDVKEKYIEESQGGQLFINTIPCHFLEDSMCTIYPARFKECRDFPHLDKPGFQGRLLGTLLHYGRCPIIYNVVEEVKEQLGFEYDK